MIAGRVVQRSRIGALDRLWSLGACASLAPDNLKPLACGICPASRLVKNWPVLFILPNEVSLPGPLTLSLLLSSLLRPALAQTPALPPGVAPCPSLTTHPPVPPLLPKEAGAPFWAPAAPAYPYLAGKTPAQLTEEAQCLSAALESYIKAWLDGKVSAQIPAAFLPVGYDAAINKSFTLVRPEDIRAENQWTIRPAQKLTPTEGVRGAFPDPNATYLAGPLFAPFGSKAVLEGQFPHARFFDIQASPAFWPANYRYGQIFGVPEVPLVDVDIDPAPGSANPFRVGADRRNERRRYQVTFELTAGDPTQLDEAFRPPTYRQAGNVRHASGIQFQGPWGAPKAGGGHGRGIWDFGSFWVRYYAPDLATGPRGGVALPKVTYVLPDGRRYYIKIEDSASETRTNQLVAIKPTKPHDPDPRQYGPAVGWSKEFGIFRAIALGVTSNAGFTSELGKQYVRHLDRGATGRDQDLPGAAHYEPSATTATYINYFARSMSCQRGKVVVLSGRLPTTPRTRAGQPTVQKAQARYWSLVGYTIPTLGETLGILFNPNAVAGLPVQAVMDEEIVTDKDQRYVLVLSRPEDRPANATAAAGVTWLDWGPRGEVSWTLRWMSVQPEWSFALTPSETFLPWATTDWASPQYNPALLGGNNQTGKLGEYLPRVSYLSKVEFEQLGKKVTAAQVPVWK